MQPIPVKLSGSIATSQTKLMSEAMIREVAEFGGRIDILFNNAGAGLGGFFDKLTNRHWERAFALNFYGALYGIRAVLPIMRQQGGGQIVDIVSGIAFAPMAQQSMYSATKAALNALTLALRYELWDENIRVSSATPGVTATGIWEASGVPTPPGAQSAGQAARTILAGVAKNERLVLGDQGDAFGAKVCFNPEAATAVDDYLLECRSQEAQWRVCGLGQKREEPMNTRPWLKSYSPGARWDAPIEFCPVQSILDTAAKRFGPLPALQFMDKRISYAELEALANRAASGFQKLGVGPGVHVALYLPEYAPLPDRLLRSAEGGWNGRQYFPGSSLRGLEFKIEDSETDILVTLDLASSIRRQRNSWPPRGSRDGGRRIRRMGARAGSGQRAHEGRRNAERAEVRRTPARLPLSY